jgi:levanase/fructan beta-fructosidase
MKNKKTYFILFVFLIASIFTTFLSCKKDIEKTATKSIEEITEETLYRPNFHFTPKANWMNDPNGMFYLNGKYHLYFQYYPMFGGRCTGDMQLAKT